MRYRSYLFVFLFVSFSLFAINDSVPSPTNVDFVIFSYNRPMQLYALLESVEQYITGLGTVNIVCRSTSEEYTNAYAQVKERYPHVQFKMQGNQPAHDFKVLTIDAIFNTPNAYVIFAVDDMVVKDYVNLDYCVDLMERTQAYGFYLRMGMNLSTCYSEYSKNQPLPPCAHVKDDVYAWIFAQGRSDWHYPNTVDMTIYRKKDIEYLLKALPYTNPNVFESVWAGHAGHIFARHGLYFKESKVVNIPLNMLQTTYNNPCMHAYSPEELMLFFNRGLKIDIEPLHKINNRAAHMEYLPTFIAR